MVGNGKGAKSGILFKTAASLEEAGRIQIVALDKTGTITKGEPKVTDIIPAKAEKISVTLGSPFVIVPVLSRATICILPASSSDAAVLNKMPDFAPLPLSLIHI